MTAPPTIAALERIELGHWLPSTCEPLGPWVLRAHHGFTGRANSVLALGDPAPALNRPLAAVLDTVRAFYAGRGLPPLMALPVPADAGVDVAGPPSALPAASAVRASRHGDEDAQLALRAAVEGCGWHPGGGTSAYTLTAPVQALRGGPGRPPPGVLLHHATAPGPDWLAVYRYRGQDLPRVGHELFVSAPEQVFLSLRVADRTVAVARGSLSGGWAGVTAVEVAEDHRRQGLARLLLAEIARWAADRGAASAFLQTAAANGPAHALYLSAGFGVHHRYDYLTCSG